MKNLRLKNIVLISRQVFPLIVLCGCVAFIARVMLRGSAAQSAGASEKQLHVREFKDMPIVVREIRNLKSESWYQDLEIEIKNVSSKPIYGIHGHLSLPDLRIGDGRYGIPLIYGEGGHAEIRRLALPGEPHLDPGETYVFAIPKDLQRGLEKRHLWITETAASIKPRSESNAIMPR